MTSRRAFTLVEMMMASGIFVLVAGGVLTAVIGVQRMTRTAFAEAELSIRMRELREKLLFHAAPPHEDKVWSGILSGSHSGPVVEDGRKILMSQAWGFDLSRLQVVEQSIELVPVASGTASKFFGNDGDRYDEKWTTRWLDPGGRDWLPEESLDDDRLADGKVFYVALESSVTDSSGTPFVTRRERIVVPVFGHEQRTLSGKVFDD